MNCPHCNITLVMAERSGVEIDYCPQCRGIWLDRGELDKIIERASQPVNIQTTPTQERQFNHNKMKDHDHDHDKHSHKDHFDDRYEKHHKKKSWIGDIFDF